MYITKDDTHSTAKSILNTDHFLSFSLFLIQRGATSVARPVGRGSLRCYAGFDPSERSLVGEVGG